MRLPGYLTMGLGDSIINTLMAVERVDVPGLIGKLTLGREPGDPTDAHIRDGLGAYSKVYGAFLGLNEDVLTSYERGDFGEIRRLRGAVYRASRELRSALTKLTSNGVVKIVERAVEQNFTLDRNQSTGSAIRTQLTFLER